MMESNLDPMECHVGEHRGSHMTHYLYKTPNQISENEIENVTSASLMV